MISFQRFFGVKKFNWFVFRATNRCNLHCEYCSSLCNEPFDVNSKYPDRREPYEISIEDYELFCERFEGVGQTKTDFHRLSGGEPTTIDMNKLTEIIDIFKNNSRRVCLFTNGYNLMGIPENYLKKISLITLDNHGINEVHIKKCMKYLKNRGFSYAKTKKAYMLREHAVIKVNRLVHYDLEKEKAKQNARYGRICKLGLMHAPVLWRGFLYPCCIHACLVDYDDDKFLNMVLGDVGWFLGNSNVGFLMAKWKETLPSYFFEQCLYNCWIPCRGKDTYKITKKKNDVIVK